MGIMQRIGTEYISQYILYHICLIFIALSLNFKYKFLYLIHASLNKNACYCSNKF